MLSKLMTIYNIFCLVINLKQQLKSLKAHGNL